MGVCYCLRADCQNIMCDTYINGIGYICDECQEDFIFYVKNLDSIPVSDEKIKEDLKMFLETPKHTSSKFIDETIQDFFKKFK